MRPFKQLYCVVLLGIFLSTTPRYLFALGFKEPQVLSFLNQSLIFQVEISDDGRDILNEFYNLEAAISQSEFNVKNPIQVEAKIVSEPINKKIAIIRTKEIIKEPFIELNLKLERNGMMVSRIFNILLEPPTFLSAESEKIYTVDVKSADTVWSIAERFLQENIFSIEQMMMAIYRLNPDSFYDSNVNRLKNGTQLLIPDISTIVSLDKATAKKLFRKQYEQWKQDNVTQIKQTISRENRDEPVLEVLSSRDTKKLETRKEDDVLSNKFEKAINDDEGLQLQLIEAKNALSLLEKRFEEQSKQLLKLTAELKNIKANQVSEKKATAATASKTSSDGSDFWFYLVILIIFSLAAVVGFALSRRSKDRIMRIDPTLQSQGKEVKDSVNTVMSEPQKHVDSSALKGNEEINSNKIGLPDSKLSAQLVLSINSYLAYERYDDALRECKSGLEKLPNSIELNVLFLKILKECGKTQIFKQECLRLRTFFGGESEEWSLINSGIGMPKFEQEDQLKNNTNSEQSATYSSSDLELDLDLEIQPDSSDKDDEKPEKN